MEERRSKIFQWRRSKMRRGGVALADAHTLNQAPVIEIVVPPQGGRRDADAGSHATDSNTRIPEG